MYISDMTSGGDKLTSWRLPIGIADRLKRQSDYTGKPMKEIVVEALEGHFAKNPIPSRYTLGIDGSAGALFENEGGAAHLKKIIQLQGKAPEVLALELQRELGEPVQLMGRANEERR